MKVETFYVCPFRLRRRHSSKGSAHSSIRSSVPPAAVLENIVVSQSNKHIATSHQDTTEGAVHCFQDEYGIFSANIFLFSEKNILFIEFLVFPAVCRNICSEFST